MHKSASECESEPDVDVGTVVTDPGAAQAEHAGAVCKLAVLTVLAVAFQLVGIPLERPQTLTSTCDVNLDSTIFHQRDSNVSLQTFLVELAQHRLVDLLKVIVPVKPSLAEVVAAVGERAVGTPLAATAGEEVVAPFSYRLILIALISARPNRHAVAACGRGCHPRRTRGHERVHAD